MRDLGIGLVERPHRVFVMTPEPTVAKSDADMVVPTSDLPTLPQIHQLADKLRRTRTRLHELEIVVRTFNEQLVHPERGQSDGSQEARRRTRSPSVSTRRGPSSA